MQTTLTVSVLALALALVSAGPGKGGSLNVDQEACEAAGGNCRGMSRGPRCDDGETVYRPEGRGPLLCEFSGSWRDMTMCCISETKADEAAAAACAAASGTCTSFSYSGAGKDWRGRMRAARGACADNEPRMRPTKPMIMCNNNEVCCQ